MVLNRGGRGGEGKGEGKGEEREGREERGVEGGEGGEGKERRGRRGGEGGSASTCAQVVLYRLTAATSPRLQPAHMTCYLRRTGLCISQYHELTLCGMTTCGLTLSD